MKKLFAFALAATTLVGFSACSNEDNLNDANKGFINLKVNVDDAVLTRATATAAEWYAYVTDGSDYLWGVEGTKWIIGSEHDGKTLNTKPFTAGTYTVSVSNFQSLEAALAADAPYGKAYYEANGVNVVVKAGETASPTIECGKAKNAQLTVSTDGFAGSALSVEITTAQSRSMTFTWSKVENVESWNHSEAFFNPAEVLNYTITYSINTYTNKTATGTITLGAAGTRKNLKIASNDQGNIVLTITYDDEFTYDSNEDETTITIDGASGNPV